MCVHVFVCTNMHQTPRLPKGSERVGRCRFRSVHGGEKKGGREKLNSRVRDNVMGGRVREREGEGGQYTQETEREREREKEREWTEGLYEERCGGDWSEREHEVAHCRQRPKIEPLVVFLLRLRLLPLLLLRCQREEGGEVSQEKLHCRTPSSERRRELSRDEPGRVSEKAALLPEGGMAMEYGLPFQDGRTKWRMDG